MSKKILTWKSTNRHNICLLELINISYTKRIDFNLKIEYIYWKLKSNED